MPKRDSIVVGDNGEFKEKQKDEDGGGPGALTIGGAVVASAGVIAMAASAGVAAAAKSDYDEARDAFCTNGVCTDDGLTQTDDARSQGDVATIVFGVGAGATAIGISLLVVGLVGDANDDARDTGAKVKTHRPEVGLMVTPQASMLSFSQRF
ncbi:MAG: hypothetical protein AAGA56_26740 [Myxococcota bacterium]